jgi:alpha-L-fucosidase
VPAFLRDAEKTAALSQQTDDPAFARTVRSEDDDLGSRAALTGALGEITVEGLAWYPAEVDTSIRPGWFHHPAEDAAVRTPDELFALWLGAVGGNCTLLLNVPPTRDGLIAAPDVAALAGLGERIADFLGRVLALAPTVSSGVVHGALDLAHDTGRWSPDPADTRPALRFVLPAPTRVAAVVLREEIAEGQRVERVVVRGVTPAGEEVALAEAGAVGYQRILTVAPTVVTEVVVELPQSRGIPVIAAAALVSSD